MPLNWLLRSWLQNAARDKVREAVYQAAQEQLKKGVAASEQSSDEEESDDSTSRRMICHVGVVFALPQESGGLEDRLDGVVRSWGEELPVIEGGLQGRGVVIVQSGSGAKAAARATEALFAGHNPQWIVSAGFASGLQPRIKRGDIVMADSVAADGEASLSIDLKVSPEAIERLPGVHVGPLLEVDRPMRQASEKKSLGEKTSAIACDLQSLAVAQVCRQRKTRFLAVRVISDAVDDELPLEIENLTRQQTTAAKLGAVLGAATRRPSSVKDMLKLKEDALRASDRLAKFLEDVILQLVPKN